MVLIYFATEAGIVFNVFWNFERKWVSCSLKIVFEKKCIAIFVNWRYSIFLYQSKQQMILNGIRFLTSLIANMVTTLLIGTTDARVACSSCFYSAIFQLTSAKFQTFAYNSRTVGSSCMKFWQQFEINELYVCTQFRDNRSSDFGFTTQKPPRKFGVKSGLSQKRLK